MYGTYSVMQTIRNEKRYSDKSFEDLAFEFQNTNQDDIIAEIFIRLYPAIIKASNKYTILDMEDKAHFALTAIQRTLSMYRSDMKCKYMSYFLTTLNRSYIGKVNTKNGPKREIWKHTQEMNHYDLENAIDATIADSYFEKEYNNIESNDTIRFIFDTIRLTEDERNYLRAVIDGCTPTEIKERVKTTSNSKISVIKKSVRNKLSRNPRVMEVLTY